MPEVSETKKVAVEPNNPAAGTQLVTGAATVKTGQTKESVALLEEEEPEIVDEEVFDGIGGFLAVEDRKRGLTKAFGGDKIVTLSDGSRYVVPKELDTAAPISAANKAARQKKEDAKKKAAEEKDKKEQERLKALAEERGEEYNPPSATVTAKSVQIEPVKK